MGTLLLAIAIALAHGMLAVFIIVGAPPAARRPRLMRWYLVMLVPTGVVNLAGLPCPLTVWEKHFWRLAGETPYRGGFISHYFVEPFYAPGLGPGDETLLRVAVVTWCLFWLLYSAVLRLRLRSGSIPQSHARPALDTAPEPALDSCAVSESRGLDMSDDRRCIELAVEVPGSPEEVWRAVATGPGISSWYVPHTVEEREGGGATASFGPEPEMQIQGRVAAWKPPHRVVFDGGEDVEGMAFEWTVDAQDGDTCIVRLVNSGFERGDEWDALYDDMTAGWQLFMLNLRLHMQHFRGRTATSSLATAACRGTSDEAWTSLTGALGIPPAPAVGDQVKVTAPDAPALAGTVADAAQHRVAVLLDQPAPGTALIAVHRQGGAATAAIWRYLYGGQAATAAERDDPLWREWLSRLTPQEGCEPPAEAPQA